jgi:glycosyltransferase involved in cell wall biosynthesis
MKQYTILHTIETAGPGGAETVLLNLASRLNTVRFRSLALLPSGTWLPGQLQERKIPTVISESRGWYDPTLLAAMIRVIRKENVDLIHAHLPGQNFYSCVAGRLTHRKVIATYHGPHLPADGNKRRAIMNWFINRWATSLVVVSDYLKGAMTAEGFPTERISRIYNGVDLGCFAEAVHDGMRSDLGYTARNRLVGMVANLRQSKGYEYFVRAADRVCEKIPEARFLAIGEVDESLAKSLRKLVQERGLEGHVTFLGFRPDVPQLLQILDVFVLSSVNEGLSIATIEAMAAGRPVVVTRSGGPQEIVEDGRTGFLVPCADPNALAAKICELLRNPTFAAEMGRNARATVHSKFSVSEMVHRYEQLYERCLNSD